MKKWFFILLFLSIVIGIVYITPVSVLNEDKPNMVPKENINLEQFDLQEKEINKEEMYQGELLLVNDEFPVKERYIKKDMIQLINHRELIANYGLLHQDLRLSEKVARKFSDMVEAAQKDNVHNFLLSSAFRDQEEQKVLYEEKGKDYALPPGYSEHNLGLALDVGSTKESIKYAAEGAWIQKNAWKFGFVLRYPKAKVHITGIEYEPWHLRYVGLPHSAIMYEKNLVLEEYLTYLKKEKQIATTYQGEKFLICFFPVSEDHPKILVPTDSEYTISGNNMDGVIVTTRQNMDSGTQV
ncbi:M15 family metallopeptidase [Virgibacillus sp. AGTR]|uniref:M15 family metallopeptidase n=1 Tax=Virgibacillus TaxID=84406 RepID=UPI001964A8ED|nr:M15 family metallopeptidase [Virgibacillus sp. AGTR]MCC2250479.1 M15 family metallopeptidase [Virgibacillus sp. AGTR]QRZ19821.1 M15 family metallopeptidase [Virgibacillus sp. AGTR]